MKKLISLLLAVVFCFVLVGCIAEDNGTADTTGAAKLTDGSADTTTANPADGSTVTTTGEIPDLSKIDLSEYVMIRPEKDGKSYVSMYADFYAAFVEKTGNKTIRLSDDFVREGTSLVEVDKEVLIGKTNREESAQALEGLEGNPYVIKVIGTKIVINGASREALQTALELFVESCLAEGSTEIDAVIDFSGQYNAPYYEVLNNIRLTALGDSYFGGSSLGKDGVWLKLLADEYNMTLRNYGIGGSTISNFVTNKNPMCDRYTSMTNGADVVILEGGRNDYSQKVPLGTVDSRDTKTFAGAINVIIDGFKVKYPEAMLMGVTSWYVNSAQQEYNKMMLAVCEKQGIVCFDASDQAMTGVYMDDANFRAQYSQSSTDVSHLNAAGMELVKPAFAKFIAENYTEFLKNKG